MKNKRGREIMTKEQLLKHLQFCKVVWNGFGEDIFQEACLIALQRYHSLNNVNQSLFSLLCKEAARKLLKHKKYETTFTQLFLNEEEEEKFINSLADPRSNIELLDYNLNEKKHKSGQKKHQLTLF
jgi:DNA-directed RNA polymerase specialized sigma24 family protein